MAQPAPQPQLTYRDLMEFPADGNRHELIEGEHYMTPAPSLRHQRVSRRLARRLVDPLVETVAVFRLRDGILQKVEELERTRELTSPLLPGLEIRLDEIF